MAKIFAETSQDVSSRELKNMDAVRQAAAEGMVLLENNGVLPLTGKIKAVALLGSGARLTVKGGTGSGDVNSRTTVNIEQGLEDAGFVITTKALLDKYDRKVEKAEADYFDRIKKRMNEEGPESVWSTLLFAPFSAPEMDAVTPEEIMETQADAAIYIISRNSGEGKDRRPVEGDYELSAAERESISSLADIYGNLIVVLNVGGVIDTKFLRSQKGIGAVLLMSQAGNVSGLTLADVLRGRSEPSGRLTATWAENYLDYPNASNFSHMNGDIDDEYYTEGIYVGYRYFDTFDITPAYPFGYGKSYTSFDIKTEQVKLEVKELIFRVTVKNVGAHPGKEVVQLYCSAPQGRLDKPFQELAAFAKTKLLAPGESETLTLKFSMASAASYDEEKAAWVLGPGDYILRSGIHSRNTKVSAVVTLEREVIVEQLKNLMKPDCSMEHISPKGIPSFRREADTAELASAVRLTLNPDAFVCKAPRYSGAASELTKSGTIETVTVADVQAGRASLEDLVSQLSVRELAELCVGTAREGWGSASTIGAASAAVPGAAGDTTSLMLESRDIRNMVLADGPAGLRLQKSFITDSNGNVLPGGEPPFPGFELLMESMPAVEIPPDAVTYYQYCTAIPIATMLAQTWSLPLIEEMGSLVGGEMEKFGVTVWLAPGMNIQRNPLCGRNFEYYSEDPLLSGLCAAADTLGVQSHKGMGTTIKHFACNNQEDNRMHVNSHVGERALREIYLKGFEIAVHESQPMSIMTSYNLINGVHSANSRELLTSIARDEWGFEGCIMTDWGTTGSVDVGSQRKSKYGSSSAAGCIWAGNDLIMPGSQADVDEIIRAAEAPEDSPDYPLTLAELQRCAVHILKVLIGSSAYERE